MLKKSSCWSFWHTKVFTKCVQSYRATPLGNGLSPAQMLFNKRIKSTLPIQLSLLKSESDESFQKYQILKRTKQK